MKAGKVSTAVRVPRSLRRLALSLTFVSCSRTPSPCPIQSRARKGAVKASHNHGRFLRLGAKLSRGERIRAANASERSGASRPTHGDENRWVFDGAAMVLTVHPEG